MAQSLNVTCLCLQRVSHRFVCEGVCMRVTAGVSFKAVEVVYESQILISQIFSILFLENVFLFY